MHLCVSGVGTLVAREDGDNDVPLNMLLHWLEVQRELGEVSGLTDIDLGFDLEIEERERDLGEGEHLEPRPAEDFDRVLEHEQVVVERGLE